MVAERDEYVELGINLRIVLISPFNLNLTFSAADFEGYEEYAGEAYGVVTPMGREALILPARTERLVLDRVYTGETLAAMIDHIQSGQSTETQTVPLVHTGGTPALFAYADEILAT